MENTIPRQYGKSLKCPQNWENLHSVTNSSSTQAHPAKIGHVLVYSPCLDISVWQEIIFNARQTCKKQINTLTETKLP